MPSRAEQQFAQLWELLHPSLDLHAEHRFDASRRWRFDFAHLPSQTAIEIEGGVWTGGRHTTGAGFTKDCVKYLSASLQGWLVLRLTPSMITADTLTSIAQLIEKRSHASDYQDG